MFQVKTILAHFGLVRSPLFKLSDLNALGNSKTWAKTVIDEQFLQEFPWRGEAA